MSEVLVNGIEVTLSDRRALSIALEVTSNERYFKSYRKYMNNLFNDEICRMVN